MFFFPKTMYCIRSILYKGFKLIQTKLKGKNVNVPPYDIKPGFSAVVPLEEILRDPKGRASKNCLMNIKLSCELYMLFAAIRSQPN